MPVSPPAAPSMNLSMFMPLAIAKVCHEVDPSVPQRTVSLALVWERIAAQIHEAMRAPVQSLCLELLSADQREWLPTSARFLDGRMVLEYGCGGAFNSVILPKAVVVGHITKPVVQIISGTESFVLRTDLQQRFALLGVLLCWSLARPAGLYEKLWHPPLNSSLPPKADLLLCEVTFRSNLPLAGADPLAGWRPLYAILKTNGALVLLDKSEIVHHFDLTAISERNVRQGHYSLFNSPHVIILESVYLKLASDEDFDDWFVALKAFTSRSVYAPVNHAPEKSVRLCSRLSVSKISIRQGEHAQAFDFCDCFVELVFANHILAKSPPHNYSDPPTWSKEILLRDLFRTDLPCQVFLRNKDGSLLGRAVYTDFAEVPEWRPMDDIGAEFSVLIESSYAKLTVLDASHYLALKGLVHELDNLLAFELGVAMPNEARALADDFVRIYQAEGLLVPWLCKLIACEVKRYAELESLPNTMFRESSMCTRALERFMHLRGRKYLQHSLGRVARKILDAGSDLELDPARIKGNAKDVKRIAGANLEMCKKYMQMLWQSTKNAEVPVEFRYVFSYLAAEMRSTLKCTDQQVRNALSAFLFLRFFTVALLNPVRMGLAPGAPDRKAQRGLILMAKILQGFSHGVPFGSKEPWLIPINGFLSTHKDELLAWYDKLVSYKDSLPQDRPRKEPPLRHFMGEGYTNPHHADLAALYAGLVQCGVGLPPSENETLQAFAFECKAVIERQVSIVRNLEKPDGLWNPEELIGRLQLKVNYDSTLFSNHAKAVEAAPCEKPSERQHKWSGLLKRKHVR